MNKKHLLIVDGMALLFRAFYATAVSRQFMVNSAGIPTNAVQGYMRHLLTAVENVNPTHLAVCWDMGSKTFRNEMYNNYKSNRTSPPVEMIPQFDLAKEVTTAFGIPNIGIEGFEADDCIGTICDQYKEDMLITVLTGDRDLLQIVDNQVHVLIMQKGIGNYQHYTAASFLEEYQLNPNQMVDVKALMGDSSDGYPGVRGIGEKTALKLIQEYKNIEGLLDNLPNLTKGQRTKIEEDTEMLHLCRALAKIKCDVPLQFGVFDAVWGEIPQSAFEFVHQYELKTVRNHLMKASWVEEADDIFSSIN